MADAAILENALPVGLFANVRLKFLARDFQFKTHVLLGASTFNSCLLLERCLALNRH